MWGSGQIERCCAWRSSTRKRGAVTDLILRAVPNYSYRRSANYSESRKQLFYTPADGCWPKVIVTQRGKRLLDAFDVAGHNVLDGFLATAHRLRVEGFVAEHGVM